MPSSSSQRRGGVWRFPAFAQVALLAASVIGAPAVAARAVPAVATGTSGVAPAAVTPVTFAIIGDFGVNDANEQAVADIVAAHNVDFVITVGDNIYSSSNYATFVGTYYGSFIGLTPKKFFPALGNHDLDDVCGVDCNTGYLNYFGPTLPGAGVTSTNTSGSNNYYDFVQGPVHFFVLDTEHISSTSSPNTSGAQYLWLQAQLPASTSLYNVVIVPQTPYSSSSLHSGVGPDGGASLEYLQWPFEAWGATAVFSGDEHNYERLMRDDNADATELPYIVTGNGGRVLNGFDTPAVTGSQVRLQQFGAVIATADGSGITFEERTVGGGSLGTLSDTVTVDAPQVPPWTAYIDTNGAGTGTDANALSLTPPNGTTCSAPCDPFPSTDTFTLKDFSDGSALTGIQMQVDANVDVVSNNPTTDPFTFGDQGTVFGGKVSGSGVSLSTSTAGHKFDLNFTGLDDTKTYTVVVGLVPLRHQHPERQPLVAVPADRRRLLHSVRDHHPRGLHRRQRRRLGRVPHRQQHVGLRGPLDGRRPGRRRVLGRDQRPREPRLRRHRRHQLLPAVRAHARGGGSVRSERPGRAHRRHRDRRQCLG